MWMEILQPLVELLVLLVQRARVLLHRRQIALRVQEVDMLQQPETVFVKNVPLVQLQKLKEIMLQY
tara:strand:- start:326 stop:523 length:198 start_codon:yes stop_codon:yes gene_type:complete